MIKKLFVFTLILIILTSLVQVSVHASAGEYYVVTANTDGSFSARDNAYTSFEQAYEVFNSSQDAATCILGSDNKVYAIKKGMVITRSSDSTLVFSSTYPGGVASYVANNSVCYFVGIDSSAVVTMRIASFTGSAHISQVILIPSAHVYPNATGNIANSYEFDYYTKDDSSNLIHCLSNYSSDGYTTFAAITVDKAPEFMAKGVRYYSVDSFHYYTDPYEALDNSVASASYAGFHCIYYKYLSLRTKTAYTESQLNSYIAYRNATYRTSVTCAYLALGGSFLSAQNTYGVNAALELAFANHESAYGKSGYAVDRHNIFGINAVDSDPDNAYYFTSTAECIRQHAYYTLSRGYFDAITDSRYFGSNSGDKGSGVNAKYASDPWHGEKIASHTYMLDSYLGGSDYGRYTIGMTSGYAAAYYSPSTSSRVLYTYTAGMSDSNTEAGMSLVILGEEGDFYKVQSDMPITEDGYADYTREYDYERSVAYVLKSRVSLVYVASGYTPGGGGGSSEGGGEDDDETKFICYDSTSVSDYITANNTESGYVRVYSGTTPVTTGDFATAMTIQFFDSSDTYQNTLTVVVRADLNGDGKVDTTDLVLLRRHLSGLNTLSGANRDAANINGDSNADLTDLVILRRYLAGLTNIKEQ